MALGITRFQVAALLSNLNDSKRLSSKAIDGIVVSSIWQAHCCSTSYSCPVSMCFWMIQINLAMVSSLTEGCFVFLIGNRIKFLLLSRLEQLSSLAPGTLSYHKQIITSPQINRWCQLQGRLRSKWMKCDLGRLKQLANLAIYGQSSSSSSSL